VVVGGTVVVVGGTVVVVGGTVVVVGRNVVVVVAGEVVVDSASEPHAENSRTAAKQTEPTLGNLRFGNRHCIIGNRHCITHVLQASLWLLLQS